MARHTSIHNFHRRYFLSNGTRLMWGGNIMIPDDQVVTFCSGDRFTKAKLKRRFITDLCIIGLCNDPVPGGQVTWDTRMLDNYSVITNSKLIIFS